VVLSRNFGPCPVIFSITLKSAIITLFWAYTLIWGIIDKFGHYPIFFYIIQQFEVLSHNSMYYLVILGIIP